jgi:hypothetical protein
VTEDEARAALAAFLAVGDIEPAQPWEPVAGGWWVWEPFRPAG